jgi:tetratricopeptide (TPR) repeat protein
MDVGAIVGRGYAIEAVAGSGGMCSVYRARNPQGGLVAVKALSEHALEAEERFEREVRMLKELRHPAIVQYLDSGTEHGRRFLVMEWLEGLDLEALLRSRSLVLEEVLAIASRVAHALGAAHEKGIVHRDVKPSNIFVVGDDVTRAKLLDFGVARWSRAANRALTITGTSVGTPAYMAPEQVRGDRHVDARADVFALGCVIYECLTGEPAFVAHNPMAVFCKILVDKAPRAVELFPGLPDPVDQLLQAMLAKDAHERPANGAAVAAAIDELARRVTASGLGRGAVKATRSRQAITADEQRLVNVVVAAAPAAGAVAAVEGDARTVRLFPNKVPVVDFAPGHNISFRFDALSDGSLVALLETRGVATDNAISAARFALTISEEIPGCQIAITTGLAVVGKARLVGEAIDRACGLVSSTGTLDARGTGRLIRIDEVTAGLIGPRFEVVHDARGPVLVAERPADAERTLLGRPAPFVGRNREVAVLSATFDEALEQSVARALLVTGPAGAGKSRLVREFLRGLDAHGRAGVWPAAGDPVRPGSPLELMANAVSSLAGLHGGEAPSVRQQKVRALVARHVPEPDRARVADFLGELLGMPATDDESVPLRAARLDPILMADQVRRALQDLLAAHTAARPVVLVLEDLHWGDQATVALVDRALRELAERRFVVLAVARPELHDRFPRIWSAHNLTEVRLGPLPRRAAQALASAVLGASVAPERISELVDRAEGNPFYLEELVRNAAEGSQELPETLVAITQARIDALEPEARRLLRAASIFGGLFWRGGVQALCGDDFPVESWLDVAVARELVSPAEDTRFLGERAYRFRHELVREAAYALLLEDDRRFGHAVAGSWLERVGERDPLALARHFDRGAQRDRALPHYLRAAETALERGDFAAVQELADAAERCGPDSGDLGVIRVLQADASYWRGEHTAAEKIYVDAMVLLPRGGRRWYHAVGRLMTVWAATDAVERMESLARVLVADDDPDDDREARLGAQAITASRLYLAGRNELADAVLTDAEAAAADLAAAPPALQAAVCRARATRSLVRDGDPAYFRDEMARGGRCFEEIGDVREACFQHANVGYADLELGLYAEAEHELRAALATAERLGLDHVAGGCRQNLGCALGRQGRLREAIALEQQAAACFEERHDRRFAGASHMYLGLFHLLDGATERAELAARTALSMLTRNLRAQALALLAQILLATGRAEEALGYAEEGMRALADRAVVEGDAQIRLAHAEALTASGRSAEAARAIAAARERLLERADRIKDAALRSSFLDHIAEHARTLALAAGTAPKTTPRPVR